MEKETAIKNKSKKFSFKNLSYIKIIIAFVALALLAFFGFTTQVREGIVVIFLMFVV